MIRVDGIGQLGEVNRSGRGDARRVLPIERRALGQDQAARRGRRASQMPGRAVLGGE
ncbi:MAG: hypothetical protein LBK95_19685 [Bifidobacteriaceae bacterium]|jgi:hypothetical protein|nr:hypothetical protein [Bifidobacteriaceae bacterium]